MTARSTSVCQSKSKNNSRYKSYRSVPFSYLLCGKGTTLLSNCQEIAHFFLIIIHLLGYVA
jgi:hypothetical protein